ncbi:uncharacterized protein EAF02_009379 [Botrytis sinoallii]|uniref:uncharacterized protein n=1 Tax=Botrytis sinoallii TaxID=1463999 RepID=UPI001901ADCA|nr:uncharacterized protein EAF02_009379 [Botrytis sinoallii]KAF7870189.1 hypothetical protein EAF02_009379 [Botrytis sinoallii]
MNADTAYTDTIWLLTLKQMASDFLAMPGNKIIDITTIDTKCTDNLEYMEALTGAGSGITVLSAPDIEEKENEPIQAEEERKASTTSNSPNSNAITNVVNEFKLTLQRFKCHRKQIDSLTGPRNEIYWGLAAGSDVRDKESFRTGKYGEIVNGSERTMGQTFFNGAVKEHFAGHIECWEQDDSGDSFYNRMVQTLKDISDFAIDAAVKANSADDWGDEHGSTGKAAAILALVGICGRLVAALLEWLTNDDDLVIRREIAFTKPTLIAWSKRTNSELSFMFDGAHQGKHELWIKCEAFPHSTGILRGWKVISGTRWDAPVVAGSALDGISLANFNNELCGVFLELNGVFHWTKYDGSNRKWSSPIPIVNGTIRSGSCPTVATHGDRLYCMYRHHESDKLYCISAATGSNWTSPALVAGTTGATIDGPALCGHNDRLIAVHRGVHDNLWYNTSSDGETWTTPTEISSRYRTNKSPALFVYNNIVHCFIRLPSSKSLGVSKYNGNSWSDFEDLRGAVDSAPQVGLSSDGKMIVGYTTGRDYLINFDTCDKDGNWSYTSWWSNVYISGSPGMINWDGVLWIYAGLATL